MRSIWVIIAACVIGLTVRALCSCTPAQQAVVSADAAKLSPIINGSCTLLESAFDAADPTAAPVVTMGCTAVEDIDGALRNLAARGITKVTIRYACAPVVATLPPPKSPVPPPFASPSPDGGGLPDARN